MGQLSHRQSLTDRIQAIARRFDLDVFKYGIWRIQTQVRQGMTYQSQRPLAGYAPWLDDQPFRRIYERIQGRTLVEQPACHELWALLGQVTHVPGDVLEVGVWRGGTGALLASCAPAKRVYLCDTFTGVVKASAADSWYRGGEHADTSAQIVIDFLDELGLTNAQVVQGIFPDESADRVGSEQFCFAHIDVDVYESAKDVFEWVWPKMPVGAITVFDDYGFHLTAGVTKLVNEYRGRPDMLVLHNLNGHGVIVKRG